MSIPEPSNVLRVANGIESTKAAISELQAKLSQLEVEWAGFWLDKQLVLPSLVQPRKGGRKPDPTSLQARIVAHMDVNAEGYDYFTAEELEGHFGASTKAQIERALFKLYQDGKIGKEGRGRYTSKPVQSEAIAA